MSASLFTNRSVFLLGLLLWLVLPLSVLASDIEVVFEATPLFSNANIIPGDSVARTITVTNNTPNSQPVYFTFDNFFDTGLAEVMNFTIEADSTKYFDDSLDELQRITPLSLLSLPAGDSVTFILTASLPDTVGNLYQVTTVGFDIIIGFVGGQSQADTPARRSGGGRSNQFELFNEAVEAVDSTARTATITWNSNYNASSYLVCGEVENGPFTLTADAPLFGYEFAVPEVDRNTKNHSLMVAELALTTYECRPAGRRESDDKFTVGQPVEFDLSLGAPLPGSILGVASSTADGEAVGKPDPLVKGAQVSQLPLGAINAGVGYLAASPWRWGGLIFIGFLMLLLRRRVARP